MIRRFIKTGINDIIGTSEADTLTTDDQNAVVFGSGGDDMITLGDGADTVLYSFASDDEEWYGFDGSDTITDFTPGEDRFVLVDSDGSAISLSDLISAMQYAEAEGFSLKAILDADESHMIGFTLQMPNGGDGENTVSFKWDAESYVPVTSQISDEDIWAFFGKDGLDVIALADISTEFA